MMKIKSTCRVLMPSSDLPDLHIFTWAESLGCYLTNVALIYETLWIWCVVTFFGLARQHAATFFNAIFFTYKYNHIHLLANVCLLGPYMDMFCFLKCLYQTNKSTNKTFMASNHLFSSGIKNIVLPLVHIILIETVRGFLASGHNGC